MDSNRRRFRYLPTGPLAVYYSGEVLGYIGPCWENPDCIHLTGSLCVRSADVEEVK